MNLAEGLKDKSNEPADVVDADILSSAPKVQEPANTQKSVEDTNPITAKTTDFATSAQTATTLPTESLNSSKKKKTIIIISIVLGLFVLGFIFLFLLLPALAINKLDPVKQVNTVKENSLQNLCFSLSSSVGINKLDNGVYAWEKAKDPKVVELMILPLNKGEQYTFKWFSPEGNSGLGDFIPLPDGSGSMYEGVYFVTTKESYGFCYIPADLTTTLSKNTKLSSFQDKYACAMEKLDSAETTSPNNVFQNFK